MKTWIAEDVLCDWSCGMAVVVANSEKEAIDALLEDNNGWALFGSPQCECHKDTKEGWDKVLKKYHKPTRLPDIFKQVKEAKAFSVYGGS